MSDNYLYKVYQQLWFTAQVKGHSLDKPRFDF